MLGVAQLRMVVAGAVIAAFGEAIFCVTTCDNVLVQPFAPVTVTVYVPGIVTLTKLEALIMAEPFDQE
jgi:hypothetical protein